MHRFKELEVWKKSVELAVKIYQLTKGFPDHEKFGLISQMNRSAVSISSNIAEGAGRNSNGEFKQFLGIASGSLFELDTQLIIAKEIGYLSSDDLSPLSKEVEEITKMIAGLKKSLNKI